MIILLQQFTLVSCRRVREIGCFSIPRAQRTDLCSHGDRFCQASLEEQTRKDARIQNAINSSLKLVSKLHLWSLRSQSPRCLSNGWNQAAGGGADDCPNSLEKRDRRERNFFKEKRSQWMLSVPSRTERTCSYPTHAHRSCVSSVVKSANIDRHIS